MRQEEEDGAKERGEGERERRERERGILKEEREGGEKKKGGVS